MFEILEDISVGKGSTEHTGLLEELANAVQDTTMCGLGQTAPNPVMSTLRYFNDEYETHIRDKACPAGVCKDLITYSILEETCTGCEACVKVCPEEAITGTKDKPHVLDAAKCIKCGACFEVCTVDAVVRE